MFWFDVDFKNCSCFCNISKVEHRLAARASSSKSFLCKSRMLRSNSEANKAKTIIAAAWIFSRGFRFVVPVSVDSAPCIPLRVIHLVNSVPWISVPWIQFRGWSDTHETLLPLSSQPRSLSRDYRYLVDYNW